MNVDQTVVVNLRTILGVLSKHQTLSNSFSIHHQFHNVISYHIISYHFDLESEIVVIVLTVSNFLNRITTQTLIESLTSLNLTNCTNRAGLTRVQPTVEMGQYKAFSMGSWGGLWGITYM